jgi:predicted ATP-dependent serine protease
MIGACVAAIGGPREPDGGDPCQSLASYEPERVERLRVCEPWQTLLGGDDEPGLPVSAEGTSACVFGKKGCGKSSLVLELAASLDEAVWVPAEPGMGPGMLRAYAARMGLRLGEGFRVVEPGNLEEMVADVGARPRTLVVVDSISTFRHPIDAWEKFREASPGAALWCIVHANKRGEMVGEERLAHLCDTVIRVGQRIAIPQKNRFGPPRSAPNRWWTRKPRTPK